MAEKTLDNSTINKLIPEIFDQMRVNLNVKKSVGPATFGSASNVTTQSLLEESKALDKIIPVIENLDKSLKMAGPQHLKRIQETCISTNKILDTWIKIQSQAGYAYDLMSSEPYLNCIGALQRDDNKTAENVLQSKRDEIATLKAALEEKKRSKSVETADREQPKDKQVSGSRTAVASRGRATSGIRKPTGIPRSTSRVARPTVTKPRANPRRPFR